MLETSKLNRSKAKSQLESLLKRLDEVLAKDTEEMPKTMALTQVNAGMTILCVFLVGGLLLLLYKTFWHQIHNENIYNDITENEENEMRSPLKSQMQGDGSVSDIHNGGFTDEEILGFPNIELPGLYSTTAVTGQIKVTNLENDLD